MAESNHNFSELFIHVVWHCLQNRPLIHAEMETDLYQFVSDYCKTTDGVYFKGVGGTKDHIHVVLQIKPELQISTFVGKLKGSSAREMNKRYGKDALRWQRGYGVVSFAKKNLPQVLEYINNQKDHHRKETFNETLERIISESEARSSGEE